MGKDGELRWGRNKGTGVGSPLQSCLPASANEVDIVANPSTKEKEKEMEKKKKVGENGHSDEVG